MVHTLEPVDTRQERQQAIGHLTKEPKRKKMGRPKKYTRLLRSLDGEDLYTAASIAGAGVETGFIGKDLAPAEIRQQRQRVRITMGRLSQNWDFPTGGDGQFILKGQAPMPAWFGWRRQTTLEGESPDNRG